jgi:Gas vesicle synthesis protein GvpL/GvpF
VKRLVHAVLRVGKDEGRELVLPAGFRCLISDDLAVAFCEVAALALTPTVPRLEAFARAVAELHRYHTTIPFRFGCTVESDSQLAALLRDHRSAWLSMLDRVEQCDEYSVHLPPHPESATHQDQPEATPDDPQISEPNDRPGTNYLMARWNTLKRASAVRDQALARAEQVLQALEGLYRSYEINPPIPGREMLVTLVFLVPRASSTAFLSAVEAASHPVSGPLLATGPWPPYHFTAPLSELESSALLRS